MAKIVLGSYVFRAPLGGYLSWVLQWLVGFKRLGHEVVFVEKAGWPNACYDPVRNLMGDDCSHGTGRGANCSAVSGWADRGALSTTPATTTA